MRTIHKEAHLIERIGWLRAAVLGANDGLIWTSSLIVGVAAATTAQHEILVAGIAGLVAGPWGIRTSSLWYAIVGNTAPAGSYAAARKSNLRWLRAPATKHKNPVCQAGGVFDVKGPTQIRTGKADAEAEADKRARRAGEGNDAGKA